MRPRIKTLMEVNTTINHKLSEVSFFSIVVILFEFKSLLYLG